MFDSLMSGGSGAFGFTKQKVRRPRKVKGANIKESATLPVFPNVFPYNEFLLNGTLRLGRFGVKTRSWDWWKYRGPVLLYTSSKNHWPAANAYDMNPADFPHRAIVGVGKLVNIRLLTGKEKDRITMQFNNWNRGQLQAMQRGDVFEQWIAPFEFGFFFENLRRFKAPVPFNWPPGPVQLNKAPLSLVAKSLKEVGYDA